MGWDWREGWDGRRGSSLLRTMIPEIRGVQARHFLSHEASAGEERSHGTPSLPAGVWSGVSESKCEKDRQSNPRDVHCKGSWCACLPAGGTRSHCAPPRCQEQRRTERADCPGVLLLALRCEGTRCALLAGLLVARPWLSEGMPYTCASTSLPTTWRAAWSLQPLGMLRMSTRACCRACTLFCKRQRH